MDKPISCGILIIQDSNLFMCHSTGNTHWDIPKGINESVETYAETAVRELREETGFIVSSLELNYLGTFHYNANKHLALFMYTGKQSFDPEKAYCTSMFKSRSDGQVYPEVDQYKWVSPEDIYNQAPKSLARVIKSFKSGSKDLLIPEQNTSKTP